MQLTNLPPSLVQVNGGRGQGKERRGADHFNCNNLNVTVASDPSHRCCRLLAWTAVAAAADPFPKSMPLLQQLRRNLIKSTLNSILLRSLSGTAAAQAAPALSRAFTEPLLYRDFIHQSLYHPVSVPVPLGRGVHHLVVTPRQQHHPHILLLFV